MTKTRAMALGMTLAAVALPAVAEAQNPIIYQAALAPEALGATGTGVATVTWNTVLNTMRVQFTFSGLSGNTTVSHIHCCTAVPGTGTAGVATVTPSFAFPLGVTSGSFDGTFDLTATTGTWNNAFVTANGGSPGTAAAALFAGLNSGRAYLNVHSSTFGGGEIRGFLTTVPEPSTYALMAVGLAILIPAARRRRR